MRVRAALCKFNAIITANYLTGRWLIAYRFKRTMFKSLGKVNDQVPRNHLDVVRSSTWSPAITLAAYHIVCRNTKSFVV